MSGGRRRGSGPARGSRAAGGAPTRTLVLIDGSNVSRCAAWVAQLEPDERGDLAHVRRRLVDAVASWAGREGVDVLLAFDGAGPWRPGRTRVAPGVEVEGSGGGQSGDDLLEGIASDARRAGRAHWLVTNDRALRDVAGSGALLVLGADEFVEVRVARATEPHADDHVAPPGPAGGIGSLLDPDVAARLERLRRGQQP